MSKKFLLSKAAGTKVAIGVATVGGISSSVAIANQILQNQPEAQPNKTELKVTQDKHERVKEKAEEQKSQEAQETQEEKEEQVTLPSKAAKILDEPALPSDKEESNVTQVNTDNLDKSERTETAKVPYATKVVYDNELPSNYKEITQKGEAGESVSIFEDFYNEEGKVIQSNKVGETSIAPKDEVITIGTKEENVSSEIEIEKDTLIEEDIKDGENSIIPEDEVVTTETEEENISSEGETKEEDIKDNENSIVPKDEVITTEIEENVSSESETEEEDIKDNENSITPEDEVITTETKEENVSSEIEIEKDTLTEEDIKDNEENAIEIESDTLDEELIQERPSENKSNEQEESENEKPKGTLIENNSEEENSNETLDEESESSLEESPINEQPSEITGENSNEEITPETSEKSNEEVSEIQSEPKIETEVTLKKQVIERDVVYTVDPKLVGDEQYTEVGFDGEKEITITKVFVNGVQVDESVTKEVLIKAASNDVIYISEEAYNRYLDIDDNTEVEIETPIEEEKIISNQERTSEIKEIDFETIRTEDPDLAEGEVVVDQIGLKGSTYDVYYDTLVNGEVVSSTLLRTVTTNSIPQIERVGTKIDETSGSGSEGEEVTVNDETTSGIPGAEVTQKTVTERMTAKIETKVIYDSELPEGQEIVESDGAEEITEVSYRITSVNEEEISREQISAEVVQKGQIKIIRIGTAKTTTSVNFTSEKIPFDVERREDPTLTKGEEKVLTEGSEGVKLIEIKTTYLNGQEVSSEVIKETISSEPKNKVILIGTKEVVVEQPVVTQPTNPVERIVDLSQVRDTSASQGLMDGDILASGRKVITIKIKYNQSAQEIKNMSEDERYNLGKENAGNSMISTRDGRRLSSGVPLSQGTVDYINNTLDVELLNKYMLQHVNELRLSVGKKPLIYKQELQQGTTQRSNEQAGIGSLRTDGKAHTRPDGTSYRTAFYYLNTNGLKKQENTLGENIAQYSSTSQFGFMSEKLIAEKLFNQWKNSPGHYANMIGDYKYFAFDASIGRVTSTMNEDAELYPSVIGVQIFQI